MSSLILLALGVVVLSGILSMVEASLFSYPITKARLAAQKGSKAAKIALEVREKPFRTIATFVILSTTVSTVGSVLVGSYAASIFSSRGVGIFSAFLTFFAIIFSEILPKNIGERWSYIVFPIAAVPLRWLSIFLGPLVKIFEIIAKPVTTGASPFMTSEEEIALLTRVGASEGTIKPQEAEMIQRVFKLNDITAGDMMTPKLFADFIDGSKALKEISGFIKSAKHSRFPVYEGDTNNIVGIVHQRDLFREVIAGGLDKKVSEYAREAMIVPESRLADDLLRDFQEKRSHLAVVVSDYGNVVGVVGLEDVLEELVGEIIDEKDVAPELIKRVSKSEIIAHGQTRIAQVNHFFNTEVKSHKTVNGFLLEKFGKIPEKNEKLEIAGLVFHAEEVGPRQIDRVRIVKI